MSTSKSQSASTAEDTTFETRPVSNTAKKKTASSRQKKTSGKQRSGTKRKKESRQEESGAARPRKRGQKKKTPRRAAPVRKKDLEQEEAEWEAWEQGKHHTPRRAVTKKKAEQVEEARETKRQRARKRKKKRAAREKNHHIEEGLAAIYQNKDGSLPDMQHFEPQSRFRLFRAVFSFLLSICFLGAIGVTVFFFYPMTEDFSKDDVQLSVEALETVRVGEAISYRVGYTNTQAIGLNNVELHLRYPEGFVFETSSIDAVNEAKDEWHIGYIPAGGSDTIEITGTFYGDPDKDVSIRSFLRYEPENFNATFQSAGTFAFQAEAQPLGLRIDAPATASGDSPIPVEIAFDLSDQQSLPEKLAVEIDLPEGIVVEKSSIDADPVLPNRWHIDAFSSSSTIDFSFIAQGFDTATDLDFPVRIIAWEDVEEEGRKEFVYAQEQYRLRIAPEDIVFAVTVNGGYSDFHVQPGEWLEMQLIVKNMGDQPMENVRLDAWFDAPSADRRSILKWEVLEEPIEGNVVGEQIDETTRRGTITWRTEEYADFASFAPGAEETFVFRLPVKDDSFVDLEKFTTHNMFFETLLTYTLGGEEKTKQGNRLAIDIVSNVSLRVEADAFERNDLSEDALAQQVTWTLTNDFHTVSGVDIEMDVYGDTLFEQGEGFDDAPGTLVYDEGTKKLTWTIDELAVLEEAIQVSFGLIQEEANPSQTQLTSDISFAAVDTVVNHSIERRIAGIALDGATEAAEE